MKKRYIFLPALVLCLLILASFFVSSYLKQAGERLALLEKRKAQFQALGLEVLKEVEGFKGNAGILIKDLDSGWELVQDSEKPFPSASLAKVPIMGAVFLAVDEGKFSLEKEVVLKEKDKLSGSGKLKNVPAGAKYKVKELIGLMIYNSDNTATNMLTGLMGLDYLNSAFKSFGLKTTTLSRRVADFSARNKGFENYTNCREVASILEKIYSGSFINPKVSEMCLEFLKLQHVRDRIPKYLPQNLTIANKTGLERGICHDAGIIFTPKGDLLICVLTSHKNPNSRLSKEFIAKVSLRAYEYAMSLETVDLSKPR